MSDDVQDINIEDDVESTDTGEEKVEIPKSLLTKLRQTERQSKAWRDEEKQLRQAAKRASDLEARLKKIEDSEKSELDRAREELARFEQRQQAWETERRETALQLAVHSLSPTVGLADTEVALALLPRDSVEYDDTGKPTNLQALLEELVERKPILKTDSSPARKAALDGGSGGKREAAPQLTAEQQEWAKKLGYTDMSEYVRDMQHLNLSEWQGAKPAA